MTSQFMRLVVRPARDVDRLIDGMMDYGSQFLRGPQYDNGWSNGNGVDEVPNNLIQYPTRRTDYTARRAANG
jgi:hypothetical protein